MHCTVIVQSLCVFLSLARTHKHALPAVIPPGMWLCFMLVFLSQNVGGAGPPLKHQIKKIKNHEQHCLDALIKVFWHKKRLKKKSTTNIHFYFLYFFPPWTQFSTSLADMLCRRAAVGAFEAWSLRCFNQTSLRSPSVPFGVTRNRQGDVKF